MPDVSFFHQFTPGAVGIWTFLGVFSVALTKMWPVIKARIREARLADNEITGSQWRRFQGEIRRLDQRIKILEREVAECRKREDAAEKRAREAERRASDAEARAAKYEAIALGAGQSRQEAAIVSAATRIVDDAKKDGMK